ncbi:MAG: hypothetical protein P1P82_05900 [Bacteroidales bacterium]|nr:hypothetical protein [Bacteroidales bacterium]
MAFALLLVNPSLKPSLSKSRFFWPGAVKEIRQSMKLSNQADTRVAVSWFCCTDINFVKVTLSFSFKHDTCCQDKYCPEDWNYQMIITIYTGKGIKNNPHTFCWYKVNAEMAGIKLSLG